MKLLTPFKAVINAVSTAIFMLLLLSSFTILLIGIIMSLVLAAVPGILALAQLVLSVLLGSEYESLDEFFEEIET